MGVVLAVSVAVALVLGRMISEPLRRVTAVMAQLAAGNLDMEVPGRGRKDEIGAMASALVVFQDNARDRERLQSEQSGDQAAREARQARIDALIATFRADVQTELSALGTNMERMQGTARTLTDVARNA